MRYWLLRFSVLALLFGLLMQPGWLIPWVYGRLWSVLYTADEAAAFCSLPVLAYGLFVFCDLFGKLLAPLRRER